MEILKFPHPALLHKCNEVTDFYPELEYFLDEMWETMKKHNGLGLAANQVGLMARMFVMEGPNKEKLYLINPKIVAQSVVNANLQEGCLSAPEEFLIRSDRVEWVQVKYQNVDRIEYVRTFYGLHSVCVQHEMEHLDGISYMESKSIPRKKRNELASKWGLK